MLARHSTRIQAGRGQHKFPLLMRRKSYPWYTSADHIWSSVLGHVCATHLPSRDQYCINNTAIHCLSVTQCGASAIQLMYIVQIAIALAPSSYHALDLMLQYEYKLTAGLLFKGFCYLSPTSIFALLAGVGLCTFLFRVWCIPDVY